MCVWVCMCVCVYVYVCVYVCVYRFTRVKGIGNSVVVNNN